MAIKQHAPLLPGAFIKRVYLDPLELSSNEVSRKLRVNPSSLDQKYLIYVPAYSHIYHTDAKPFALGIT